MDNPDKCYEISRQTLELMDQFAGPVNSQKRNLPSILQFPEHLSYQPYQPNILKRAPFSTQSQVYVQHTEMDENPNMPHYQMEHQYMEFNHFRSSYGGNSHQANWNFENLTSNNINEDSDDDEDWNMISQRARIKTQENVTFKRPDNEPRNDINYFVQQDIEKLNQLREKYGFKFSPSVEYILPQKNPLFADAV